jgi:Zn-dependent metalloprotease
MKKNIVCLLLFIGIIRFANFASAQNVEAGNILDEKASAALIAEAQSIRIGKLTNTPSFVQFKKEASITEAEFFRKYNSLFHLDSRSKLVKTGESRDEKSGITYYSYQQYFDGIPVEGAMFRTKIHDGKLLSVYGNIFRIKEEDAKVTLNKEQALAKLGLDAPMKKTMKKNGEENQETDKENGTLTFSLNLNTGVIKAAYRIEDGNDIYYVDANTGALHNKIENRPEAFPHTNTVEWSQHPLNGMIQDIDIKVVNTGPGSYLATLEGKYPPTSPLGFDYKTAEWNNTFTPAPTVFYPNSLSSPPSYPASVNLFPDYAAQAHFVVGHVLDYWYNVHGDLGMNQPTPLTVSVNVPGSAMYAYTGLTLRGFYSHPNNIYLRNNPNETNFDVVGHEMMHGYLRSHNAAPQGVGEYASLNEALCDINGFLAGNYALQQNYINAYNWPVDMVDPNNYGFPDTYLGEFWNCNPYLSSTQGDNYLPHWQGRVIEHWFYLLCTGGSGVNEHGEAYSFTGIGTSDAEQILFHSIKDYLSTYSDFHDLYLATMDYCASSSYALDLPALEQAWLAVGIPFIQDGLYGGTSTYQTVIDVTHSAETQALSNCQDCSMHFMHTGRLSKDPGDEKTFVMQTGLKGNVNWLKTYHMNFNSNGKAITPDKRNASYPAYAVCGWIEQGQGANKSRDMMLMTLDDAGNMVQTATNGKEGVQDEMEDIINTSNQDPQPGYVITGHTESYGNGNNPVTAINKNIYIAKWSVSSNSFAWQITNGDEGYTDKGKCVEIGPGVESDPLTYMIGGEKYDPINDKYYIVLIQVSPGGSIIFRNEYPVPAFTRALDVNDIQLRRSDQSSMLGYYIVGSLVNQSGRKDGFVLTVDLLGGLATSNPFVTYSFPGHPEKDVDLLSIKGNFDNYIIFGQISDVGATDGESFVIQYQRSIATYFPTKTYQITTSYKKLGKINAGEKASIQYMGNTYHGGYLASVGNDKQEGVRVFAIDDDLNQESCEDDLLLTVTDIKASFVSTTRTRENVPSPNGLTDVNLSKNTMIKERGCCAHSELLSVNPLNSNNYTTISSSPLVLQLNQTSSYINIEAQAIITDPTLTIQWYRNGLPVSCNPDKSITITDCGTYYAVVTDPSCGFITTEAAEVKRDFSGYPVYTGPINSNTYWSFSNLTIDGTLTIQAPASLSIASCNINFTNCAQIVVEPGASLNIDYSDLGTGGCSRWLGIRSEGHVGIYNSSVEGAYIAVWGQNSGIDIHTTHFKDNRKHVYVNNLNQPLPLQLIENTFDYLSRTDDGCQSGSGWPGLTSNELVEVNYTNNMYTHINGNIFVDQVQGGNVTDITALKLYGGLTNVLDNHFNGNFKTGLAADYMDDILCGGNIFYGEMETGISMSWGTHVGIGNNTFNTPLSTLAQSNRVKNGIIIKECGDFQANLNKLYACDNGMQYYEQTVSNTNTITTNLFKKNRYGLIVATVENPLTAGPATNNSNQIELSIHCNKFDDYEIGVLGSGVLIDQGSQHDDASNVWYPTINSAWDMLWQGTSVSPDPVYYFSPSAGPAAGSGTYTMNGVPQSATDLTLTSTLSFPAPSSCTNPLKKDPTGIEEKSAKPTASAGMQLMPNPSDGRTSVVIENADNLKTMLEVVDILGKVRYKASLTGQAQSETVNLSGFSPGVYFVTLQDADGRRVKTLKWIVR